MAFEELFFIQSQCRYCRHFVRSDLGLEFCPAFPGGIPNEITMNKFDHRKSYPEQEGSTLLELQSDVPEAVRVQLFHQLDQASIQVRKDPIIPSDPKDAAGKIRNIVAGFIGLKDSENLK